MELGSEFSLKKSRKPCADSIFHYLRNYQTIYTDSGRSALRLLLPLLPPGPILLPAYICESAYTLFQNRKLIFYELTDDLRIDWEDLFQKLAGSVSILYLHYFNGCLPESKQLKQLAERKKSQGFLTIEDTTHSIFSQPLTAGDYGLCSLRKWFPIPDGGVLYSSHPFDIDATHLPEAEWIQPKLQAMALKAEYLEGKGGEACNLKYRSLFAACEKTLDEQQQTHGLSASSQEILQSCSVSELIKARRENLHFLAENLKGIPGIRPVAQLGPDDCPLVCPARVKDRDALRTYLISQQIYCAVHWPALQMPTVGAARIAEEELSFPIDQRYGASELSYLLDRLLRYEGIECDVETH